MSKNRRSTQCENRIELTTRAQPLGGRRWWFVCPRTGQLAERLHLPSGTYTFACRKAYRLAYRSQREAPRDRAISRAFSLRRKLGDDGGIGDYVTCTGALLNAPWKELTGRRTSSTGTPFSCSIASTGSLPDSKPHDGPDLGGVKRYCANFVEPAGARCRNGDSNSGPPHYERESENILLAGLEP